MQKSTQPSTSTADTNTKGPAAGGGGANVSHGLVFHLTITMLLLFRLVSMQKSDPGFQYHIWLEKSGYGKFDDIVLKYKKSGGKWLQICVQCKHGEEKFLSDGTKYVKTINADDLLSGKNKQFALVEYIKSFSEVKDKIEDCETFYVMLTNRKYVNDEDEKYTFLQREDNVNLNHTLLNGNGFKIKYEWDKKTKSQWNNETTQMFCEKFLYICDDSNLEADLQAQLIQHCKGNTESKKNLQARLYFLVSQMYQQKRGPTQNDFMDEFNGKNIHYKIQPPHKQFIGRTNEINKIKIALESEKRSHIFDLLVTGMTGMGKTHLVRKYIDDNKQNYKHVVWINAESCVDLDYSFVDLARACQLVNTYCNFKISDVMEAIYSYFSNDTIFVFDNASKELLFKHENREYIYLPNHGQAKYNKFIVISQDEKWTTNHAHVTVDQFSEEEALLYMDDLIDCKREEKLKLAASVQFWPLALCLAVSCITFETDKDLTGKCISDAIELFETDDKYVHEHLRQDFEIEPYRKSLSKLWQFQQNKIKEKGGGLAIRILNILSFSYPDNFPVDLLKFDCCVEDEVTQSILTLVNLSLLTIGQREVSIHRAVQTCIRTSLISDYILHMKTLAEGTNCFNRYLIIMSEYENRKTLGNIHLLTFIQYICDSQIEAKKYVEIADKILAKITESDDVLIFGRNASIFDEILSNVKRDLGQNCEEYINIANAKGSALNRMGKYDEALSIYNHVIEIRTKKLGKEHLDTVNSMQYKASVLARMGKFDEALRIYNHVNQVIQVETEKLVKDHPNIVNNIPLSCIDKMRQHEEVPRNDNRGVEIKTETLDKDHPKSVISLLPVPAAGGGGGADSSHGLIFHLTLAMLLLFSLKSMQKADPGFLYHIWLEKTGYGKFDDIVLRYKKRGGHWIQICMQCKHGEEKIGSDGTKSVKSVNADDLLSGKNKQFALVEYMKCFSEVKDKIEDCETFYVLLTNRKYVSDLDGRYAFLELEPTNDLSHTLLNGNGFSIKHNYDLHNHVVKQTKLDKKNNIEWNKETTETFCFKFLYIYYDSNLEEELQAQLFQHCKGNAESMKNLQARLYYLVSQMFQHKKEPSQNDFIDEFNGRNIHYKVQPPHPKFIGRTNEINKIKIALDNKKGNQIVDLFVTGMAGMGKTQVVLKYIEDNKQNYKHVIWINAESSVDLDNSFVDLARTCQLINADGNIIISDVMVAIYSYFIHDTIFVFDNASKDLLSKNKISEYIYLPNYGQAKNNKFVVISQDKKLTTNHTHVRVDKFSEEEALLYMDSSIDCAREEKLNLATSVQFWPLALCLAVSYIKLDTDKTLGGKCVSDVIELLKIDDEIVHKHLPQDFEMEPYSESLSKLWQLLQIKLQTKSGELAIKILHILSFSYPDNFPVDFLKFDSCFKAEINEAISLLVDLSILIGQKEVSIHRTLQSVIRSSVISDNILHMEVLVQGTICFNSYLESLNVYESRKSLGNMHLLTFIHYVCDSDMGAHKYVNIANKILTKITNSGDVLIYGRDGTIFDKIICNIQRDLGEQSLEHYKIASVKASALNAMGKYSEALSIYNHVIEMLAEKVGTDHLDTVSSMDSKASVLDNMGKYDEAQSIYNHVIGVKTEKLGKCHPRTIRSMHNKALLLNNMGKYDEALSIYNHVIEVDIEQLGKDHPDTLTVMINKALVLDNMGKYDEALDISNNVIEVEIEKLGKDHSHTLTSMSNKASFLYNKGKYDEALSTYNHVIEVRTDNLGKDHPETLTSMSNKAAVLGDMEKYDESLSTYNHVIEVRIEKLGTDHPDTVTSMSNKAALLVKLKKYDEALSIFDHVVEVRTKMLGKDHPSTVNSMLSRGSVLGYMGKHDVALNIFNHVIEVMTEILGKDHPSTVNSMNNKAFVLSNMGKYNEALSIYNQVIEVKTETLGKNHLSTVNSMNNKAFVLKNMEKLDEALFMYNHVIEIRTNMIGTDHPDTVNSMKNKAFVLDDMGKYDEALRIYNLVIDVETEKLGKDHLSTVTILQKKAIVLKKIEKYDEALKTYNQMIEVTTDKLGKNHPDTVTSMSNKAAVLVKMGKYDEALNIYNHVIEKDTEKLGKDHPGTAASMSNKATVLVEMGKYDEALSIFNHVIEVKTKILSKDHPHTVDSMKNKAFVLYKMGKYDEAQSIFNQFN